jgi:PEP-CTERM motif
MANIQNMRIKRGRVTDFSALPTTGRRPALAFGLLATISSASYATTVPFNQALVYSVNPSAGSPYYSNIVNSNPLTSAATPHYSESDPAWGSVEGFASANLATGELKMSAGEANGNPGGDPYVQVNAIFGDGFTATTTSGAPFAWTSNSEARFSLSLEGTIPSVSTLENSGAGVFVVLSILRPNTLDPAQPLINGPTAEQYFLWTIGNPNQTLYYTDPNGQSQVLIPTGYYPTLPSTITANFTPDGDFDWVLAIGASGQTTAPNASWDVDLADTVTLDYSGPGGSVTKSASGVFSNFVAAPVPEPGTWAMVLAGFAALGWVGRRRAAAA